MNLSGQSVQTQSVATSTAFFDMQNSGQPVQTGWLTAGEGVLVYDPTDAAITQDSQLIAGYGALDNMAGSSSGVLDASNPLFNDLRVWVDPTGDGQFQAQDLHSLQDLGITSISLSSQNEAMNSNGNVILNDGSFTWGNGVSGDIAGVELFYNPTSFGQTLGQTGSDNPASPLASAVQELAGIDAGASFSSPSNSPLNGFDGTGLAANDTKPTAIPQVTPVSLLGHAS